MEYGHKYGGTSFELFARISEKNHAHSTLNPLAAYQKRFTLDEIMNDVMIAYPNTRPMCSGNCDGAAAMIVVNDEKKKSMPVEVRREPSRFPHQSLLLTLGKKDAKSFRTLILLLVTQRHRHMSKQVLDPKT